jgi:hypothetical protein
MASISKYSLLGIYCVFCIVVIKYLVTRNASLHFGKDDGEVAEILFTWLASWILFFVIEKTYKRFFIGLIIGFLIYVVIFLFYYLIAVCNLNILIPPFYADNTIAFLFVFLFGCYRLRKNKAKNA